MQNLFDHAPCLYFSSSDDGTLLEVNDRLCSALQYQREELIGKKYDILFTIATRIFQQTHFFPLLRLQGHANEIYISLRRKDKEQIPVLMNAERKIIDDKPVNLYVGIIVQNRKRFEEELIAAKKEAENALNENTALVLAKQELQRHAEELDHQIFIANKQNDELRQFNRVVTHDMQEPLRKLSLFSGMLQEDNGRNDVLKMVDRISKVCNQMHSILKGLQQYVWLSDAPLKVEDINLPKLLSHIESILQTEFPGIELNIETEGIESFYGDWEQTRLLFYQLLSNVIRFRKEENKAYLSISIHKVQLNQFRNVEGKYKYVDYTRIQFTDKGIGFQPEYKSQVFELFRRLHNQSGRGIGLSICKKVIDNHHGMIAIDSAVNEGTTITIHLPSDDLETIDGKPSEINNIIPENLNTIHE
jgi:sigma-B regulation protein RsbU (phosphoserine phosphatase)